MTSSSTVQKRRRRVSLFETRVIDALSSLSTVKEQILKYRFGLNGSSPMSYEELASLLSDVTSPELRLKLVSYRTKSEAEDHFDDEMNFTAQDIEALEAEALRELARPPRREIS